MVHDFTNYFLDCLSVKNDKNVMAIDIRAKWYMPCHRLSNSR